MDASVVFSGEAADKRSDPSDHMSVTVVAEDETAHKLSGEAAEKRSGPADHMSVTVVAEDETAHKLSGEAAEKRSGPADHMSVTVVAEDETAHKLSGVTAEKRSGPADHMSVSIGQAEDETAHKLSGVTAEKRSGPADHMSVTVVAEEAISNPPDHPRVARLRHRRLMGFLRDQGFHDSYNELMNKTRAQMSLGHLRGLVERGLWEDAVEYLDRYLPPRTRPRSLDGEVLRHFLEMHHFFAKAVAGMGGKNLPKHYLQLDNGRDVSHAELRLRSIYISILAVDHVRANMNWQRVRDRASLVVSRLVHSAPELRGLIELPATTIKPHHVLPIASGLRSRRRYVKKKQTGRGRTEAIMRALKSQRLMVPEIGSVEEAKELLADLLDETLRYGIHVITYDLSLSCPLQPGGNEGAQFCQHLFDTSTEAKTSGTLANAGTNQHVVEAGCQANTDRQDFDERRNKLLHDFKRQRLTGAFGEASPHVSGPGAVVNSGTNPSGVSSG